MQEEVKGSAFCVSVPVLLVILRVGVTVFLVAFAYVLSVPLLAHVLALCFGTSPLGDSAIQRNIFDVYTFPLFCVLDLFPGLKEAFGKFFEMTYWKSPMPVVNVVVLGVLVTCALSFLVVLWKKCRRPLSDLKERLT